MVLQPNDLAITDCTITTITVSTGRLVDADVQGYIIDINPAPNPPQQNPVYIPDSVNNLETTFTNLNPSVLYRFSLRIAQTSGSTDVLKTIDQRTSKLY